MTRKEAIERFENVKANALVQKASGVSVYWQNEIDGTIEAIDMAIEALQTDAVSREEYEETDGVITINKQSAKDVGEIKRIIIRSPNYTSYFYNESMPMSADAVQGEWKPIKETLPTYDGGEKTWLTGMKCSKCGKLFDLRVGYNYCPSCGTRMKGGAE